MPISNYPGGFSGGVAIRGIPVLNTYAGNVFWVDYTTGSDATFAGKTKDKPFKTIDYAIGRCTANNGDVILVMPGYAETITAADGFDVDVAGVSIIGLGIGSDIPTIEYNHADAEVAIGADNVLIENIRFNSSITGVKIGVDIEAGAEWATIRNCVFDVDASATDEFLISVQVNAGCNHALIENCQLMQGLGGAAVGIKLTGASENVQILNNYCTGDYSTAIINGITTLSTNVFIKGNTLIQGIGGNIGTEPGIELLTGTTGVIADNYIVADVASGEVSIVADTCFLFNNYYCELVTAAKTAIIIGATT